MSDQPEPCIGGRCYSPMACGGFGYCRDRNKPGLPSEEQAKQWRERAANSHVLREPILEQLADVIADWPKAEPPNAIIQVRADLVVSAYQEIERLQKRIRGANIQVALSKQRKGR